MTEPDEQIANLFGRSTEDDKLESFERSTLKIVLRRMGMPKKRVDQHERELAEGFGFDWLNNNDWAVGRIMTTRCFSFSLEELFTAPLKSPLIKHLQKFWIEQELADSDCVIFRAHGIGRLTCSTSYDDDHMPEVPALRLPLTLTSHTGLVSSRMVWFTSLDDYMTENFTGEEIQE